jgi:16S rRNA (cytidine1402-2'-O)-methyltransferase
MSGTLFVVATPIGNLEDMTLRALRVLREAAVIAAEDTRRTAKLLAHFGIPTPTMSFHAHNWRTRVPQLLARLQGGDSVALVTDAGTPGVSDPGVELVRACIEAGALVDPIPGASAPLAVAVASGFPLIPLMILGFVPTRASERERWFEQVSACQGTVTFFEAPHRVRRTLEFAQKLWGERQICVGREMSKVHQEFLRGTPGEVLAQLGEPRGEFTVAVAPAEVAMQASSGWTDAEIADLFGQTTNRGGSSRREALNSVADRVGKSPKEVYAAVERAKKSGESP